MDKDFLQDFCVCRAEFENDEVVWGEDGWEKPPSKAPDFLLWNDEYQAYETVQNAKTRERILMEENEDFDIPY